MSGPAQLAGFGLGRCFEVFKVSAFRLETLSTYAVPAEEEGLRAFRLGLPRPERSVRTSSWLRRIADTTAAGKSWRRVRVLVRPLSESECYQLLGYRESAEAGEVIRIADRSACADLDTLARDFWLFDAGTAKPFAALMNYDHAGEYLGAAVTAEPAVIMACVTARNLAHRCSVPLGVYLAQLKAQAE
ncbi:MAG TPA: hypothetical protein VK584_20665 [Streptosporangiaceae bacterium]|jgi:hypothetical protein|nr:hypothetical protein [Streptosporangiaceae bacterium]